MGTIGKEIVELNTNTCDYASELDRVYTHFYCHPEQYMARETLETTVPASPEAVEVAEHQMLKDLKKC